MQAIATKARLITARGFCLSGNGRIPLTLPCLNRFRITLVSALQRLLRCIFAPTFIHGRFRPRRRRLTVTTYRAIRTQAFNVWHQATCVRNAA